MINIHGLGNIRFPEVAELKPVGQSVLSRRVLILGGKITKLSSVYSIYKLNINFNEIIMCSSNNTT